MKPETTGLPPLSQRRFFMGQAFNLVMYLLFVFLLITWEQWVLERLHQGHVSYLEGQVHRQLADMTPLPGKAWQWFPPLAIVAMGILGFGRWRWLWFGVSGACLGLLLLADLTYFEFFSAIVTWDSFKVTDQLWDVRDSVFAAVSVWDLLKVLVFAIFPVYGYAFRRFAGVGWRDAPWRVFTDRGTGLVFALLAWHCGAVAFYLQEKPFRVNVVTGTTGEAQEVSEYFGLRNTAPKDYAIFFGIYNFHLADLQLAFKELVAEPELPAESLPAMHALLEGKKALNDRRGPFWGVARDHNVVLISMESFQHYLLDLSVGNREVIPTMNRIKQEALSFDFILDNIGRGGTSDAEFMAMTGLLPDHRRKASLNYPARRQLLALPDQLRKAGYHTASFHGNDPAFWNRHINHPIYGFEHMFFERAFNAPHERLGVPDQAFFEQTADYLADLQQPYLAFIVSLSSHHPYSLLPLTDTDFPVPFAPESQAARFLRSAHYADQALGLFLDKFRQHPAFGKTLLIIYGDHTAPLDPESRELMISQLGIDTSWHRAQRVPFLIWLPGQPEAINLFTESHAQVIGGLQDLFATVLHLLGMEIPYGLYGVHLFVGNGTRGPLPFPSLPNAFIDQGILYVNGGRLTDREGLVFLPNYQIPKLSLGQYKRNVVQIRAERELHNLIFDADAQIEAIRYRAASLPDQSGPPREVDGVLQP